MIKQLVAHLVGETQRTRGSSAGFASASALSDLAVGSRLQQLLQEKAVEQPELRAVGPTR